MNLLKRSNRLTMVVWAITSIVTVLFVIDVTRDQRDFRLQGKYLSDYLLIANSGVPSGVSFGPIKAPKGKRPVGPNFAGIQKMLDAQKVVREVGTNAVPLLQDWLSTEMPTWRIRAGTWLAERGFLSPALPPEDLRLIACRAIGGLNGDLSPLASSLAALSTNANTQIAQQAAEILCLRFGDLEMVPAESIAQVAAALDRILAQPQRQPSLVTPGHLSQKVAWREFRQRLAPLAALNEDSVPDQARALRLLSRRNALFQQAWPHLLTHLKSTDPAIAENAAVCLGNYGAKAVAALPHLQAALNHPHEGVRTAAKKSIDRITVLAAESVSVAKNKQPSNAVGR